MVWEDWRANVTTYHDVYGTAVLADGTVVNPGGLRLTHTDSSGEPSLGSDGTSFLLAWKDDNAPFVNDVVRAARTHRRHPRPYRSPHRLSAPPGHEVVGPVEGDGHGLRGIRRGADHLPRGAVEHLARYQNPRT